jgi:hypothetical protein
MPRLAGRVSVFALFAGLGLLLMWQPWSPAPATHAAKAGDGFASDREPPVPEVPFDAKRAMACLEALCRIGPRMSGTDGMKRQQELLEKHFTDLGAKITWQRFKATQHSVSSRGPVEMANLVVSWHPERTRRVILCSHYDTRPVADEEHDRRKWRQPFLSANDGGSGVALLMELGHAMKKLDTAVGVDFVFFDGEEYVFAREEDEYFFGSKHFAREYRKAQARAAGRDNPVAKYAAALLLDMVGGKDAQFPMEPESAERAGPLVREVWGVAAELKCKLFRREYGQRVLDDHIALLDADIPAADIIDFGYPHWHRLTDVPENCSGDSLAQVARVLGVWLQRVK